MCLLVGWLADMLAAWSAAPAAADTHPLFGFGCDGLQRHTSTLLLLGSSFTFVRSTATCFCYCRLAAARESGQPEPSSLYRLEYGGSGEQQQQQPGGGEAAPPPPPPPPPQQQQEQQGDGGSGGDSPQQDGAQPAAAAQQAGTLVQRDEALRALDRSVGQVWEAAPPGTLLLVVTGQGDTSYSRCGQSWGGAVGCRGWLEHERAGRKEGPHCGCRLTVRPPLLLQLH